ncbi:MAG: YhbY family RNA-binding protein [Candidatus Altiarchaeota archaeon]|nr:YhbY family RNA-binding protein [Candidatus Altiarchaeota archaeon]
MDYTISVGKAGLDAVVSEVKLQLSKKREVKLKVNPSIIEGRMKEFTKKLGSDLAKKTNSKLTFVRGRTFILRRD